MADEDDRMLVPEEEEYQNAILNMNLEESEEALTIENFLSHSI